MKKISLLIIVLLLLAACQEERPDSNAHITNTIVATSFKPEKMDKASLEARTQKVKGELEYYLQRHTVDDEGYDMVARYAEQGDSIIASYMPRRRQPSLMNMFTWRGYKRHGVGFKFTPYYIYIGNWQGDSLVSGLRIDSAGVYAGAFARHLQASGHGCYSSFDGNYYEGHWQNDRREGFGFAVTDKNLMAGTWKAGRYHGERIWHTSERIYGIDISRYQHEVGRKRYGINWKNLRITHLGRHIKGNISGNVDYPVRFVYIKSTQGGTIRNRYLMTDYAAARKQGIPVGVYHFFSTAQNGTAQANYFLNNTLFRRGDLPPVIDVEPTKKQIEEYGGPKKLLNEVRQWIAIVEKRLHVRPILYVNQNFLNKYLAEAPDLFDNYLIWIARYGEYKPGVHLALWQLSSDSRVKGIHPDVDVNVFNGYEHHWQEFLREETIK